MRTGVPCNEKSFFPVLALYRIAVQPWHMHFSSGLSRDQYSVQVPAAPCWLSFFKIWPFSAKFHITHMYSIYKYLAKMMLLRENLPFMAEFRCIKFNLGPLHLLDNFVKEILASDSTKSYLRKEQAKTSRHVTNDLNKSAAIETIEKRIEKSLVFRHCFGKIILNKVYNCVLCEKSKKLFYYRKINR